ncbi:MAG: hypothetical protein JSR77_02445 [Planctomycetes bacterium]|nr:hypothetical protein [Planctomycetota bacterium]
MASSKIQGGQRNNITSSSGRKKRSPTSTSHGGSRVEPSHVTELARETREKKQVGKATKKAAAKKANKK